LELDELERETLSHLEELALAKLKEDEKLYRPEEQTLSLVLDRIESKKKEGLELDEQERAILSLLFDRPESQAFDLIIDRLRAKKKEGLELDELERETLSRLVEISLAKHKEEKELASHETRTLNLLLDWVKAKEGLELDELERETLSRLVEISLAKLKEDKQLLWFERKTLNLLLDRIETKNKEGLELDELERETLSHLVDQTTLQAFNLIVDRIGVKSEKGLELDKLERETPGRIALRIVKKKREDIELTQAESKLLEILRSSAKEQLGKNSIIRRLAMEDEELERQILSLSLARIMFKSIDDETTIKDILSKSLQCKYGTNQSIVRDRRKLYTFDSKIMTERLEYQEIDDFCLSFSGNTLVVKEEAD
jgi:hypothetical protein